MKSSQGISLVEDLLVLIESYPLSLIKAVLDDLDNRKIKLFRSMAKVLRKSLIIDITSKVKDFFNSLGPGADLSEVEVRQVRILLSQYIRGPLRVFFIGLANIMRENTQSVSPTSTSETSTSEHEMYSLVDAALSRKELEILDQALRYG